MYPTVLNFFFTVDEVKTWHKRQKVPTNPSEEKQFIFCHLVLRVVTAEIIHSWRRLQPHVNIFTLGNVESELWQEKVK